MSYKSIIFCFFLCLLFNKVASKEVNIETNSQTYISQQSFTENKNQWQNPVLFLSQLNGYNTWITIDGIVYDFVKQQNIVENNVAQNYSFADNKPPIDPDEEIIIGQVIKMTFVNGNKIQVNSTNKLPGVKNYFLGDDKTRWASDVKSYGELILENVYDGIDYRMYFDENNLRYDFIIKPNSNPNSIKLKFQGQDKLAINSKGELVLSTILGDIENQKIYCYQVIEQKIKQIECKFKLVAQDIVGFEISEYNKNYPLIIDPLIYSSYFGGSSNDECLALKVDDNGYVYFTGNSRSTNYPTSTGAYQNVRVGSYDALITKVNQNGTGVVFSTYLGGQSSDYGMDITYDSNGNSYIIGRTYSNNFPITGGVIQERFSNEPYQPFYDVFVTKLNSTGSALIYSTYLGGTAHDEGNSISIDDNGNAYLTGTTNSTNFPVTAGVYQNTNAGGYDGFVCKINSNATAITYSSYIGGSSDERPTKMYLDDGNIIICGNASSSNYPTSNGAFQTTLSGAPDGFVTKFNSNATNISFSTYIGGSLNEELNSLKVDSDGRVFLTGNTNSTDFPVTAGVYKDTLTNSHDIFVALLNSNGTDLIYSTYVGGSSNDYSRDIAIDTFGNSYIFGTSNSEDYPITSGAYQDEKADGYDVVISKLNPDGSELLFSTYIGGNGEDWAYAGAVQGIINAFVGGKTTLATTNNYPVTAGAFQTTFGGGASDAYISKLSISILPPDLRSPADQSLGISTSPTFSWYSVNTATSYQIQVSTSSTFGSLVIDEIIDGEVNYEASGLNNETVYFWRVKAMNNLYVSDWSDVWNFSTPGILPPPTLVSPTNNSEGNLTNLDLQWNSVNTATSYHLQISQLQEFTTLLYDLDNLTETTYSLNGLDNGTEYWWRVLAKNDDESSPFSNPFKFKTKILQPVLLTPTDNSYAVSISPTFTWAAVVGAERYDLQISRSLDFSVLETSVNNITETSCSVNGLVNGVLYYWRLRANSQNDSSEWTDAFSFTTNIGIPTLQLPINNSTSVNLSTDLWWNLLSGATAYDIQVSTTNNFSSIQIQINDITDNYQYIDGLNYFTTYFWRVRGKNPGENGAWSNPFSFRTKISTPDLTSPANSSVGNNLPISLNWNAVNGATLYDIEVSLSPGFTVLFEDTQNYNGTSLQLDGCEYGTRYYWHVRAKNNDETSDWSPTYYFTTELAPPVLTLPENNSSAVPVIVALQWNEATSATSYDVQVSTIDDFSSIYTSFNDVTNTSVNLSGLSHWTRYYWRVKSKMIGDESDWSAPFNFLTAIGTPVLVSPANNSLGVNLPVTFTWNVLAGADLYDIRVSTDANFSNIVFSNNDINSTNVECNQLLNGTHYYWQVRGKNQNETSDWSNAFNFYTKLAPPVLTIPENNSSAVPVIVALQWNQATSATSYDVQVSLNNDFSTIYTSFNNVTNTLANLSGLSHWTQYYWRVKSKMTGDESEWSAPFNFLTAIGTPTLLSPANNSFAINIPVTFTWNALPGADLYDIQVSTDANFSNIVISSNNINETSIESNQLLNGIHYYWQIRARNQNEISDWSTAFNFYTKLAPPVLLSPANLSYSIATNPNLNWQAANFATSYDVQVSTDVDFNNIVTTRNNITDLSVNITGLSNNSEYFWRVKSKNSNDESEWSLPFSFTTVLAKPHLTLPANNAAGIPLIPVFSWQNTQGADSYDIQIATDVDFNNIVNTASDIAGTSYNGAALNYGTEYYWKVRAKNNSSISDWSDVKNFTTLLEIPTLVSPANSSIDQDVNLTLEWNVSAGATSYTLELSYNSDFSTIEHSYTGITDTYYYIQGLVFSKTSYWRVKGVSDLDERDYSQVWNFETRFLFIESPEEFFGLFDGCLAWGDYDNDNDLDIVISGRDENGTAYTKLYRNDGNEVFTEVASIFTGVYRCSLMWGDYNNDGNIDLLLSGYTNTDRITKVYKNNGNGTFTELNSNFVGVQDGSSIWGDFNNDGLSDILITGLDATTSITKLYKNNGDETFTEVNANFANVRNSSAAWGDFNNDSYIDLLLSGINGSDRFSILYRNNKNGTFTDVNAGFTGVDNSNSAFADINNDGFLDVLLTGNSSTPDNSFLYKNNGDNTFTLLNVGIVGLHNGTAVWGDYNNDGFIDLLIAGSIFENGNPAVVKTLLFENNGDETFTEIRPGIDDLTFADAAWGDYDKDGDLDLFIIGAQNPSSPFNPVSKLFRNDITVSNNPPTAPENLISQVSYNTVNLSWDKSTDTETDQNGLTYNVVISTTDLGLNILSPLSNLNNGYRKVVRFGNSFSLNNILLENLAAGTYYWSVQSIDNGFLSSGFAASGSFTVKDTIKINLSSGWNLISSYVLADDLDIIEICNDIANNLVLMKNNSGLIYLPSIGLNQIGNWNITEGYQLYMSSERQLSIIGSKVSPQTPINLAAGWNIAAYLHSVNINAVTAFDGIDDDMVIAKNNNGEMYLPALNINLIGDLVPGQGYQIYMLNARTLVYPPIYFPKSINEMWQSQSTSYFKPKSENTGSNSSLIVKTDNCFNGFELGVFTESGNLVGSGKIHQGMTAIKIWGDNTANDFVDGALADEFLTIKLYNPSNNEVSNVDLDYISDMITGENIQHINYKKDQVLVAELNQKNNNSEAILEVLPNPISDKAIIKYQIPEEQFVQISLYSVEGSLVSNILSSNRSKGSYIEDLNTENLANGVYLLEMKSGNIKILKHIVVVK